MVRYHGFHYLQFGVVLDFLAVEMLVHHCIFELALLFQPILRALVGERESFKICFNILNKAFWRSVVQIFFLEILQDFFLVRWSRRLILLSCNTHFLILGFKRQRIVGQFSFPLLAIR